MILSNTLDDEDNRLIGSAKGRSMNALRRAIGIGCALVAATTCGGEAPQTPRETWVENHAQVGKALLRALSNESLWTEEAHKDELRVHLQTIRVLRLAALAPVLIAHIDYTPVYKPTDAGNPPHRPSPEKRFPAAASLVAIGMPAVPAILDEMRRTDRDPPVPPVSPMYVDAMRRRGRIIRRANRLAFCLRDIYDMGGDGVRMARLRIQLEAEKATGKERKNLLNFLDHLAFRLPPPSP